MIVRLFLFIVSLAAQASLLFAADAAEREILGFSADGKYFAFEQYGIQDGSGFPYSEIFVIDLDADSWVKGTPVRVRLDDEAMALDVARDNARFAARAALEAAGIRRPARVLASNVLYQLVPDPRRLTFRMFYSAFGHLEPGESEAEDSLSLVLEEIVLPSPEGCPAGDTPLSGFVLKAKRGHEDYEEVHRDKKIPPSRGCPIKYSLSDAVAFTPPDGAGGRLVLLVNVIAFGFEGPDRRFLAVPLQ